uniref:Putative c2h2-type zn-finger protein n=1 Tax=Ixodes ricinus TaxID=34613 RepID=A0A0K8RHL9_IXORI
MELIHSSSRGDGAVLFGKTSSPLKVTEDILFRCCSCTYVTGDQRGIVSHLVAHGDEQFKSQCPPVSSGSRSKVPNNTQKHKSNKLFKCKLCPLAFACNLDLKRHYQTHTGEKPFNCKLCPKSFALNSSLKKDNNTTTLLLG